MATSGTINGTISGYKPYLRINWSRIETDVGGNRSKLRLQLYLIHPYTVKYSTTKSGVLQGSSFSSSTRVNGTGSTLLRTQDIWVGHNSDGSKTQRLSASFNIAISFSGSQLSQLTVAGDANITAIPRASTLSAFSFGGHLKNGVANKINYTVDRKSGNFRHQIQLRDGNTTIWTWDNQNTNGSNSIPLTASNVNTLLNRIKTSTTKSFTLRVATRSGSGGSWIGSAVSRNATATVHADVKPTVGAVSLSQTGNSVSSHYLQGKSKVNAKFTRSAGYGASITSSSIQVRRVSGGADSQTINSNDGTTKNPVSLNGSYQARGTATDSRGRTTNTAWATFTVTAYSAPRITNFTAVRSSSTPTTVSISRATTHTVLGTSNNLSHVVQRRLGTGSWTNVNSNGSGTITASPFSGTSISTGNSVTQSYEFRHVVTDKFGESATATVTVSTQRVVLDIHKNEGVGIGKIHERGVLDVDGTFYMNGKIMALGGLGFEDTRTINDQPQQIPGRAFSFAFKQSGNVGNPQERAHTNFAHILNIAGWNSSEGSGGFPIQMSIGGKGISLRQGTSATAWGSWSSLPYLATGASGNIRWWRFGGPAGLQIVSGSFSHDFGTTLTKYVDLPASFMNTGYAVSISSNQTTWQPFEISTTIGAGPSTVSRARFQRYNNASHNRTSGTYQYRFVAIGRWN